MTAYFLPEIGQTYQTKHLCSMPNMLHLGKPYFSEGGLTRDLFRLNHPTAPYFLIFEGRRMGKERTLVQTLTLEEYSLLPQPITGISSPVFLVRELES